MLEIQPSAPFALHPNAFQVLAARADNKYLFTAQHCRPDLLVVCNALRLRDLAAKYVQSPVGQVSVYPLGIPVKVHRFEIRVYDLVVIGGKSDFDADKHIVLCLFIQVVFQRCNGFVNFLLSCLVKASLIGLILEQEQNLLIVFVIAKADLGCAIYGIAEGRLGNGFVVPAQIHDAEFRLQITPQRIDRIGIILQNGSAGIARFGKLVVIDAVLRKVESAFEIACAGDDLHLAVDGLHGSQRLHAKIVQRVDLIVEIFQLRRKRFFGFGKQIGLLALLILHFIAAVFACRNALVVVVDQAGACAVAAMHRAIKQRLCQLGGKILAVVLKDIAHDL